MNTVLKNVSNVIIQNQINEVRKLHFKFFTTLIFDIETENDPLNIDGENIGASPIKVELINKAVRIFGKIRA